MNVREPRYSKEEHARLGTTIYEQRVRPSVEAGNHGKIVAIDVDGGGTRRGHPDSGRTAPGSLPGCANLVRSHRSSRRPSLRVSTRSGGRMITGSVNSGLFDVFRITPGYAP